MGPKLNGTDECQISTSKNLNVLTSSLDVETKLGMQIFSDLNV